MLTIFVAAFAIASAAEPAEWTTAPPSPERLAELLDEPTLRDAALCRLFELARTDPSVNAKPSGGCELNHVEHARTSDGTLLRLAFTREEFARGYAKPGLAKGPFSIVAPDGKLIDVFEGANVMDEDSGLVTFDDERKAFVLVFPYDAGVMRSTYVLHFVPVEREQKAILKVVLGAPIVGDEPAPLSWRMRDVNADEKPDLQLMKKGEGGRVVATYLWNTKERRFVGPKGGKKAGFLSLSPTTECCNDPELAAWNRQNDPCAGKARSSEACVMAEKAERAEKHGHSGTAAGARLMQCRPFATVEEVLEHLGKEGVPRTAAEDIAKLCAMDPPDPRPAFARLMASPHPKTIAALRDFLLHRQLVVDPTTIESGADKLGPGYVALINGIRYSGTDRFTRLEEAARLLPKGPEAQLCYADALLLADRLDDATRVLMRPPRGADETALAALRARLLAARGDVERARELMPKTSRSFEDRERYGCRIEVGVSSCAFAAALNTAKRYREALEAGDGRCGVHHARAHEALGQPFEALVALRSGFGLRVGSDDPFFDPRLLVALGNAPQARRRLAYLERQCRTKDAEPPSKGVCDKVLRFLDALPTSPEPNLAADAALLARLAEEPIAASYVETAAPEGAARASPAVMLPGAARVVFAAVEGTNAVAVSYSHDVDPRGELSAGYVIYLSSDAGKSWKGPFHSGLAAGFPYVVRAEATGNVFEKDTLRLPVDVREIDASTVSFPPVGVRYKRELENRTLHIPLAVLTRDGDADGLTDLVEERIGTDLRRADTDGDGNNDAQDGQPLVSTGVVNDPRARFAAALLNYVDGFRRGAGDSGGGQLATRFVDLPFVLPASLTTRTVSLHGALDAYVEKLGVIVPTTVDVIVSPDGKKALVDFSEGWRGGSYLLEDDGSAELKVRSLGNFVT